MHRLFFVVVLFLFTHVCNFIMHLHSLSKFGGNIVKLALRDIMQDMLIENIIILLHDGRKLLSRVKYVKK